MQDITDIKALATLKRDPFSKIEFIHIDTPVSIREIVAKHCSGISALMTLYATVNGVKVTDLSFLVQKGDVITLNYFPQGDDDGKSVFRTIALIGVTIGTGALGGAIASAYGYTLGAIVKVGGGILGAMAVNAIFPPPRIPSTPYNEYESSPTYSYSGGKNQLKQYGVVPHLLGRSKFIPPHAAKPYTQIENDGNVYVYQLFLLGYAGIQVETIKIGETRLHEFNGDGDAADRLVYNIHDDYDPSNKLEYYTQDVDTTDLSVTLTEDYETRTTPIDTTTIQVDLQSAGLFEVNENTGAITEIEVPIQVQYAETGTSDWKGAIGDVSVPSTDLDLAIPTDLDVVARYVMIVLDKTNGEIRANYSFNHLKPSVRVKEMPLALVSMYLHEGQYYISNIEDRRTDEVGYDRDGGELLVTKTGNSTVNVAAGTVNLSQMTLKGNSRDIVRKTFTFDGLTAGSYDVRVRRNTTQSTDPNVSDEITWTALRSLKSYAAISEDAPNLSILEMRMKMTDQLNGMIDELSVVGTQKINAYNPNTSTWSESALFADNPANVFRHVLQSPSNKRAIQDSQIDLNQLEAWAQFCVNKGLTYNRYIDFNIGVEELLDEICKAGRASKVIKPDGVYSVEIDQQRAATTQVFSRQNTTDFEKVRSYEEFPHAWKIRFRNEDKDWLEDEQIVYWDGYSEDGAGQTEVATKFERMELPGVTNSDQVWKLGKRFEAEAKLRPRTMTFTTEAESMVCGLYDLIEIESDVIMAGTGSGNIIDVFVSGSKTVGFRLNQVIKLQSGVNYSAKVRKSDASIVTIDLQSNESQTDTFYFEDAYDGELEADNHVSIGIRGIETVKAIVKDIEPIEGDTTYYAKITCVDESPAVYSADSGEIPAFNSNINVPSALSPPEITSITSRATSVTSEGLATYQMLVKLEAGSGVDIEDIQQIECRYKQTGYDTGFVNLPALEAKAKQFVIEGLQHPGGYTVTVRYKTNRGRLSLWYSLTHSISTFNPTFTTQAVTVYLYQWATTTPGNPSGDTTYNWSTGLHSNYTGGGGWSISIPTNPGTPGMKLYRAEKPVTAGATDLETTVLWSSGYTISAVTVNGATGPQGDQGQQGDQGIPGDVGATGPQGHHGLQTAYPKVYKWGLTIPSGPSGTSNYTWSTASWGAPSTPNGWTLTIPSSPGSGYTLYEAVVRITDSATATNTQINWVSAAINPISYNGTDGESGDISGAVAAYGGSNPSNVSYSSTEKAIKIYNSSDATTGAAWPAFRVASDQTWDISLDYKADSTYSTGLYVRIYEYNQDNLPVGKTHVTLNASSSDPVCQQQTSGRINWKENGSVNTSWQKTSYAYTPNATAKWASIVVLNWSGMSLGELYIKNINRSLRGADGQAGQAGATGDQGASSRVCYARISGTPEPNSNTITVSGDNRPSGTDAKTAWGSSFNVTWYDYDPTPSSTNRLWVSYGVYNPATNQTVWDTPFWASLKVGNLSAITANTGTLNVNQQITWGSSPEISGTTMTGTGGIVKSTGAFAIGNPDRNLTWNGSGSPTLNGDWVATNNILTGAVGGGYTTYFNDVTVSGGNISIFGVSDIRGIKDYNFMIMYHGWVRHIAEHTNYYTRIRYRVGGTSGNTIPTAQYIWVGKDQYAAYPFTLAFATEHDAYPFSFIGLDAQTFDDPESPTVRSRTVYIRDLVMVVFYMKK